MLAHPRTLAGKHAEVLGRFVGLFRCGFPRGVAGASRDCSIKQLKYGSPA